MFCFAFHPLIRIFAFKIKKQQMKQAKTLTIRIGHDTLAFISTGSDGEPFFQSYEMKGGMSAAANLREAFKTLPTLADSWEKATVLADVPTMLVPEEEFDPADSDILFSHTFSGCERDVKYFVHPDDQAAFVQAMNRQFLEEALAGNRVYELPTAELKGEIRFTC